jgi:hypothetical protein
MPSNKGADKDEQHEQDKLTSALGPDDLVPHRQELVGVGLVDERELLLLLLLLALDLLVLVLVRFHHLVEVADERQYFLCCLLPSIYEDALTCS